MLARDGCKDIRGRRSTDGKSDISGFNEIAGGVARRGGNDGRTHEIVNRDLQMQLVQSN